MSKRVIAFVMSLVMVLCMAFAAPMSANALAYGHWPTQEEIDAKTKELNIPTPINLRVTKTTNTSITVSWKYEDWGYSAVYTTDANQKPQWSSEYSNRTNGSKADWQHTFDNLTAGKTYYIYVRHATIYNLNGYLTYLSGDYSRIKVTLKANNTVTFKTAVKSVKSTVLKKGKKTVKPLTISKAKGAVKVTKVKKGTSASIFKKITVNKKTGAVMLKKGKYKKGTYKIKLKISVAGNSVYKAKTVTKTVKIKIT